MYSINLAKTAERLFDPARVCMCVHPCGFQALPLHPSTPRIKQNTHQAEMLPFSRRGFWFRRLLLFLDSFYS